LQQRQRKREERGGTHRLKKWNRSVTSKNFFLPAKKAPLARLTSGVGVYSLMAANEKSLPSDERCFERWRLRRRKSKYEGTKMRV